MQPKILKEHLVRWRKAIYLNLAISLVLGIVFYSFFTPRKYQSEARIFIPQKDLGPQSAPKFSDVDNPTGGRILKVRRKRALLPEMLTAVATSRGILEKVVVRCDLFDYFEIRNMNMEEAVKSLEKLLKLKISSEGLVIIRARTSYPRLSAHIVNVLVEELDSFLKNARLFSTQRTLNYLQRATSDLEYSISATEDSLRAFCTQHGLADSLVVSNFIDLYFNLKSASISKKTRDYSLATYTTDSNPLHKLNQRELLALARRIKRLESSTEPTMTYGNLPDLKATYNHFDCQIRTYTDIYLYLVAVNDFYQSYAGNSLPVVNILDPAKPSGRPAEPELLRLLLGSILISVVYSLIFIIAVAISQKHFAVLNQSLPQHRLFWVFLISNLLILLAFYTLPFFPLSGMLITLAFLGLFVFVSFVTIPLYVYIALLFIIILYPVSKIWVYTSVFVLLSLFRIIDRIKDGALEISFQRLDFCLLLYIVSLLPGIAFQTNFTEYMRGYLFITMAVTAYLLARELITSPRRVKIMLYGFGFLNLFLTLLMLRQLAMSGFNILESSVLRRVTDLPLGSTNYLAAFLTLFMPITFSLFLVAERRHLKAVFLITIFLTMFCLVLTMSRGGLICLLIGVFAFLILAFRKNMLLPALLSAFVVLFLYINPLAKLYFIRFQSMAGTLALQGRFNQWVGAFHIFLAHPIFGAGLNNALAQEVPGIGFGGPDPHNFVLKTAAEAGLLGLSALLLVYWQIGGILVDMWRRLKDNRRTKLLCSGLVVSFIIAMVNQLFEPTFSGAVYNAIFWALIGLVCSFSLTIKRDDRIAEVLG